MYDSARNLAEMASGEFITYEPTGGVKYGPTYRSETGRKWHEMTATRRSDGKKWTYYLSHDFGSYRGAFPGAF